jgi:hypothetical protein
MRMNTALIPGPKVVVIKIIVRQRDTDTVPDDTPWGHTYGDQPCGYTLHFHALGKND